MIFKSIVSAFLSLVILFSTGFAPVAKASLVGDTVIAYSQATWAQQVMSFILSGAGAAVGGPYGAVAGIIAAEGITSLAEWYANGHTDQELYDAYNQYVTDLQSDLGTATLIDGGVRLYPRVIEVGNLPSGGKANTYCYSTGAFSGEYPVTAVVTWPYQSSNGDYPWFKAGSVKVPFDCLATSGYTYSGGVVYYRDDGLTVSRSVAQGKSVSFSSGSSYHVQFNCMVGSVGMTVTPYIDLIPTADPLSSLTVQDISINSRPISITGDYGIIGDDGTIIHIEGNKIVDESDSLVYNPVTGETQNFIDYAYDYSDRSYLLTLADGNTLKVVYGDENITIEEGDTVYNVYYLLPDSSEDPGGSGGSGDTPGTDDGSGWAWLQGAWTQMMDKLSQIREAIVGLELSPEINVDVEVNEGEEVTQESWFTDVLSKFSFLSSIRNIYSQLIADVTSDAATAAAVADGEIMLADVTTGHAATDGRASYTAPELAISFGSSDKYGVDWAGIRPLDLSWYAPYKETVDGILSGILWLSYLFLLIKRAPGIIRGSEMVTEDKIKIDAWRMRH